MAIVVPYRSQARLIRQKLQKIASQFNLPDLTSILVNTVESMQGQERDIMILSLTTSDPFHAAQKADFYFQPNRLNVAIIRARVKRIVVGSPNVFKAEPEHPKHKKWVDCFRAFYESNHTIILSQPRGLKITDKNNSTNQEKSKILDTLNSAITKKENKSNINMSNNQEIDLIDKSINVKDLAQYLENLSTSVSKADLLTNFAPLLLEVLGFGEKQIKQKVTTGNGQEIVDFAIYKTNEQQSNLPFLLLAIENINLEFDNDNPQYKARVTNLKKDLLAPKFKKVQWGLITNGKQIQLFRKHGKVIYSASIIEELNPNNLEEFEEKIIRLKTQIQNPPTALTIAIYNNKGGVGKTTTVINLAGILTLFKYKVLIIDFDCNQQDLSSILDIKPTEVTLYNALTSKENLIKKTIVSYQELVGKQKYLFSFDVIPSDQYLVNEVDERDLFQMMEVSRLEELLEPLKNEYDYILIDNPPNWRFFSQSGLCASDVVLIPTQHNDINSIQNAVTVIKNYIPEIQNYRQLSQPVALPIFFNKGQPTEAQLRTTYKTIDQIITHNSGELDLVPYFYPKSNEYQMIQDIYYLGEYAYIANANFLQKPAVYKYKTIYNAYKTFVKEYFI